MKKVAIYAATQNAYLDMAVAIHSLLSTTPMDQVICLIENDLFPYETDPRVTFINVKDQQFFNPGGPNFKSKWTYMALMRAAYTKLFPDLDMALSMDNDTIVMEDISELWDLPMEDYYFAAVKEQVFYRDYGNFGVVMMNLKKIREDHLDDEAIRMLNTNYYLYNEQECFNILCAQRILFLPYDYNVCRVTLKQTPFIPKVLHYANSSFLPWRHNKPYQNHRKCVYTWLTRKYLEYLDCLKNDPNNIENKWKELKTWWYIHYTLDTHDFNYHIIDFQQYQKPGYLLSIDKFIKDLQTSDEPSTGYLKI